MPKENDSMEKTLTNIETNSDEREEPQQTPNADDSAAPQLAARENAAEADREEDPDTKKLSGKKSSPKLSAAEEFYNWVHDLAACLTFVTIFFVFVLRLVGVVGDSMTPTLLNGDHVALLSNFFYQDIEDGDIVVMRVPTYDEDEAIVKRVIATEGQTVDIDFNTGTVTVDGEVLDEPYINEVMTWPVYTSIMTMEFPVTVDEGCIFVLGDNRNHSADSRYPTIGMVDTRYVLGKVVGTLWPFSRIGLVE